MWNGLVGGHIRRTNRNLLLMNAVLVACLVCGAGAYWRYYYNAVLGPFHMDRETLVGVKNPQILTTWLVSVDGDKDLGSYFQSVELRKDKHTGQVKSERITAHWVIAKVGDRLLLVKSATEKAGTRLTGFLEPIPVEARSTLRSNLGRDKRSDLEQSFLPFMLDAEAGVTPAWFGLAFGLPLFFLAFWNLKKGVERQANPATHPLAARLSTRGDPGEVAAQVDADMAQAGEDTGPVRIGRSWLMIPGTLDVELYHESEILWVYKKVTQHYMNGVPTGKTFQICVKTRTGNAPEYNVSEDVQERILARVCERWPWIVVGFSDELEGLWKANAGEFEAAVASRRDAAGHGEPAKPGVRMSTASAPQDLAPAVRTAAVVLDPEAATCRYCSEKLLPRKLVVCPECQTPHHADCWEENGGHCTMYGCKASVS